MVQGEDGCIFIFLLAFGLPVLAEILAGLIGAISWAWRGTVGRKGK